jgi:hypothetical protein
MKQHLKPCLLATLLCVMPSTLIHAQNTVVTYQGLVQSGVTPFTGAGQFKFALVTTTNTSSQAIATANFVPFGGVTTINVIFGGSGYVTAPAVSITGGGGSGATATALVGGGVVTSIVVNNSGTGYTSQPTVTIAAPLPALAYLTHWSNDGTSVGGGEPTAAVAVPVNHGLFTARLGDATVANMTAFGPGLFTRTNLQLRLWFDDGTNGFAALQPPQPLTATPYALVAGTAARLSDIYSSAVTFNNVGNSFSGNGANLTALNASVLTTGTVPNARLDPAISLLGQTIESSEITDGTIQGADVNPTSFNTTFWRTAGNAGTSPGPHFLGTSDNQPVELKVKGTRALRLEPTANTDTVNVIGGSARNVVGAGVIGATIGGGGTGNYFGDAFTNRVDADFGTVSGGGRNTIQTDANSATIGGGWQNTIQTNAQYATLGGGAVNTIQTNAYYATLGGGWQNTIQTNASSATLGGGYINMIQSDAQFATLGGGGFNTIELNTYAATLGGGGLNTIQTNAAYATLGGGYNNTIQTNAAFATIPGGRLNSATDYAFAAGRRAKANHPGAFVWADSQNADFASTNANQFNVRAAGGGRFVTSGAGLTVDGPVLANPGSAGAPGLAFNGDADTGVFRPAANTMALTTGGAERLRVSSAGAVGIGETVPGGQLHITGGAATPQIKIQTTANNSFVKLRLESFGKAYWDFAVGGSDNVMNWYYSGTAQNLMSLSTSGTLTTAGPVNPPSDRNVKQDFATVDALAVLEKVAALPIQSWAYKDSPETRHIGPVAQDFHATFRFNGEDDKHISTVDADGVALAAIQGLNRKLMEELARRDAEIADLKRRAADSAEWKARLLALEKTVANFNSKGN